MYSKFIELKILYSFCKQNLNLLWLNKSFTTDVCPFHLPVYKKIRESSYKLKINIIIISSRGMIDKMHLPTCFRNLASGKPQEMS